MAAYREQTFMKIQP